MNVELQKHYDVQVWTNVKTDKLRHDGECLCFQCERLHTCKQANMLYTLCIEKKMAVMITRCVSWRLKEDDPPPKEEKELGFQDTYGQVSVGLPPDD